MELFSNVYSTYSPSIAQLEHVTKRRLKRVAFVGTPCQINTLRRMEVLGIVPSDSIRYYLGLFCTGNFFFGEEERQRLEKLGDFKWEDVYKINLKEELMMIASQLTPEIGLNPQFMNFQRELMKNVDLLIGDIQKTRKFFLDSSVLAKQYGLRDIS